MAEQIGPRKHAYLSASSAFRWLHCPPIAQFENSMPNKETSYAMEGTDAHTLAEAKLMRFLGQITNNHLNRVIENDLTYYDTEMEEATDIYVDRVVERFNHYDSPEMELEVRVDFSDWVPEGFGTSDVVILSDGVIEIIDLKYGKGVPVSAYQNPQLMLYALGAYSMYDLAYDFDRIRMTIVQPRLDDMSTFEIEVEELLYWANYYVAPRALQAYEGIGEWDINADVMKFSKVRAQLRPRAEMNFKIIDDFNFDEPALLDHEEIAKILERAAEIKSWISDVESYALYQSLAGENIPGFKVVEGRSNRKITDDESLAKLLTEEGFNEDDIYKPKALVALGALEKLVGKKHFTDLASDFIVKPQGKPVLVPSKDKRNAINSTQSAIEDFN